MIDGARRHLNELRSAEARERLTDALARRTPARQRYLAARALVYMDMDDPEARPALVRALSDDDPGVVRWALGALAKKAGRDPAAISALIGYLEQTEPDGGLLYHKARTTLYVS